MRAMLTVGVIVVGALLIALTVSALRAPDSRFDPKLSQFPTIQAAQFQASPPSPFGPPQYSTGPILVTSASTWPNDAPPTFSANFPSGAFILNLREGGDYEYKLPLHWTLSNFTLSSKEFVDVAYDGRVLGRDIPYTGVSRIDFAVMRIRVRPGVPGGSVTFRASTSAPAAP